MKWEFRFTLEQFLPKPIKERIALFIALIAERRSRGADTGIVRSRIHGRLTPLGDNSHSAPSLKCGAVSWQRFY